MRKKRKHRLPEFKYNGIILIDKPSDWTSHDVVNFIRMRFNIAKVGHCGTLDPSATGLLVLVVGRFTKLSQVFTGEDKVYDVILRLGTETDTQDMEGKIIAENDISALNEKVVEEKILGFIGEQEQVPPMTSAVKKDGKKLYDLARKGIEIEREPKKININNIEINKFDLPFVHFTVNCSKGTYVRTLCSDIGAKLGCGGVLYNLKRTQSGKFSLEDALNVESIKTWEQEDLRNYMEKMLHEKLASLQGFNSF